MTEGHDWENLIREASTLSQPEGPKSLLAVLMGRKNPGKSVDEAEQQDLSNAHQSDLGAIYNYRHSRHPLSECDRAVWLDRLAWLLNELEACKQQKPDFSKLATILSVSRAFSFETSIWEHLPSSFHSDNLFACMAALVGATQCEFTSRGQREPIWEREALDAFLEADENGDWPKIEAQWQTITSAFWPDVDLQEATACLCVAETGRQALTFAINEFNSILQVINVASGMNSQQIGKVAPLLKSGRGRFGFAQSLAFNHPRNEALPRETIERLATLFREVQQDDAEWQKWMKALNRYPVRTKALQFAFGESLIGSTVNAKSAYIDAIDLSSSRSECRLAVTDCLATFAKSADTEQCKQMWKLAHERWAEWNFGETEWEGRLTSMAVSQLDYAVFGYATENLTKSELEDALKSASGEMNAVTKTWHRDITEHNSAWYRALSKWQILQYAQQAIEGNVSWELPARVHLPFNPKKDRFSAMTYPTELPFGLE